MPFWASFQYAPGIMNTAHVWQSERFHDPNTMRVDERGIRIEWTGRVRYTAGLLEQVRNIYEYVETQALEVIDHQTMTWLAARGRTFLTPDEHQMLNFSKRYLAECDRFEFKAKNSGFEPHYRADGTLIESTMFAWIASKTGYAVVRVKELLLAAENVYALRAALSMDSAPPVRVVIVEKRADTSRDIQTAAA